MEDTSRWLGISGQHGAEKSGTSGDLELVCNEAVLSRGRGPGIHTFQNFNMSGIVIFCQKDHFFSHPLETSLSCTATAQCSTRKNKGNLHPRIAESEFVNRPFHYRCSQE